MTDVQRILVTGATGKVGQAFIGRLLASGDERLAGFAVRALCHNRVLQPGPRLQVMTGSIDERAAVDRAVDGVTHVLHLAISKIPARLAATLRPAAHDRRGLELPARPSTHTRHGLSGQPLSPHRFPGR